MFLLFLSVLCSLSLDVKACGSNFTDPTGILESPGFPSGYSDNLDCMYVIKRPAGERVTLTFEQFDLEGGAGCQYDYVEIRDGDSMTSPRISRDCSTILPSPKRSFENTMLILFRSDTSATGKGFRAWYTSGVLKDEFLLITSSNGIIFRMDVNTSSNINIPGLLLSNPIAVDYDPVDGRVYWTDVVFKHIGSAYLNGTDSKVIRTVNGAAVLDGLAVDPLSRLVFYSDAGNDVIAVMSMSGASHRTVINTDLDQPRAIVLDTMNGIVFWTDWGASPKIERASYDGTNRRTLHSTLLLAPNALALDLANNRLYWADAGTDFVEYSDLEGNGRTRVWNLPGKHFFGLAYYENNLYVTDWTSVGSSTSVSHVVKLSTDGVTGEAIGSSQSRMNDIHIYSEDNWPKGPNGCGSNNGGCSHFCIPSHGNTFKCMCPDAPTNCIEDTTTTTTVTTTTTPATTTTPTTIPRTTPTTLSTPPPVPVALLGLHPFDTDGSKEMTLTCDPDGTKVVSTVTWSVTCLRRDLESRTCVWKPQPPGDDGKVVTCSVAFANGQSGVGSFTVELNYPPPATPEIHGYKTGDVLKAGDELTMTCLVRGGKPLVTSVIFSCPRHPDSQDLRSGSEVQSLVVINPLTADDNNTRCVCTAEWKSLDQYALSASRILSVQGAQSVTSRDIPEVAVGVGVGAGAIVIIIVVVIIVIVIPRMRRNKRYQTPTPKRNEPEENPYCSLGQQSVFQGHANPAADRNLEMETCGRESNIYDYIDHPTPFAGGDSEYLHPVRPVAYPHPLYEVAHSDYNMRVVEGVGTK